MLGKRQIPSQLYLSALCGKSMMSKMLSETIGSRGLALLIASTLLFFVSIHLAHAQNATDSGHRRSSRDVKVTRWIDPEGSRPLSYEEWKTEVGEPGPFEIDMVSEAPLSKPLGAGVKFCILVNAAIYAPLEFPIGRYVIELTGEGYDVEVYVTSAGTPEDLRAFLQGKYAAGMAGCVLIGDFPVPWYETVACWDDPYEVEEFPCDLFYMDLDGVFEDTDADGKYDTHTGDVSPEIWVGRLLASQMTIGGADEISLLQNYFEKNHLYRSELQPLNHRALVYVDDDWVPSAEWWDENVGLSYDDRTLVYDEYVTYDVDYEDRLTHNYELIQLYAHSSASKHYFSRPDGGGGTTSAEEVVAIDPLAYFYNLFACSNARYIEYNFMAGWYIFCQDYGLAALGSSKTGSMLEFDFFYGPFGEGKSIGEAFFDWFTMIGFDGYDEFEKCWFYGMTLQGDPTLVKQRDPSAPGVFITPTVLADGAVYQSYSETLEVTGGVPPYYWGLIAGELPDGLDIMPTSGIITGMPTIDGTGISVFTVRVFDSDSPPNADIQHLSINVPYCLDTDGDGYGDPGHPENTCPTDNCLSVYNPDQADTDGDGIGDSCEVIRSWYVRADGMGDVQTIQMAIDSCTHGDTVLLADGVYTGDGNRDLDLRGRRILLHSENGPGASIIDCQGSPAEPYRAFTLMNASDSSCIIDGITIRGGYGPTYSGGPCGGGLLCVLASPLIRNCIITGNTATLGGAVFVSQSNARFENCTFVENSAIYGGGIFSYDQSALTLDNCIIAFNRQGPSMSCYEFGTATLSCTDVFGNDGGDWVNCIADQSATNGNMEADPYFCDPAVGDFHLADISPCAPENNGCLVLIGGLGVGCGGVCVDSDGDGFGDPGHPENWCADDNCPSVYNPDQLDTDDDGEGDVCDDDDDADGIADAADNCPLVFNPGQEDTDSDGHGDLCDICPGYDDNADEDMDEIPDDCDNCPAVANADQANNDGDAWGDVCDDDDDNDGVPDLSDNCPYVSNAGQEDNDDDGQGDVCDTDDDNDGILDVADNCPLTENPSQADVDFDGVGNVCDNCESAYNPGQEDTDGDGIGDACEISCICTGFCDVAPDGVINPLDVVYLVNYVFKQRDARAELPSCPMENGDWSCGGSVDPLDVAFMVNYVYRQMGNGPCDPCTQSL